MIEPMLERRDTHKVRIEPFFLEWSLLALEGLCLFRCTREKVGASTADVEECFLLVWSVCLGFQPEPPNSSWGFPTWSLALRKLSSQQWGGLHEETWRVDYGP